MIKTKSKLVQFIIYFFLNAIVYGMLIYISETYDTLKAVLFNATVFGLIMAFFQVIISSKSNNNKEN